MTQQRTLPAVQIASPGGLDVRLALGAVGAWLAILGTLDQPPHSIVLIALIAAATGIAALCAARRGLRCASSAALVAFCIALVLVPFAGRLGHARASPLVQLAGRRTAVTAVLTVSNDPRQLAATGVAGAPRVVVDTSADAVVIAGHRVRISGTVQVLAPADQWREVLPGQQVRVDGALAPSLAPGSMSVTLFAQQRPTLVGSPPWWQRAAGAVRSSLRRAASGLPSDARGLLPGLVDGDTANLDPVLAEHFRLAGLTHLVAVSGTNCSILLGSVLLVLRRFGVRPWVCAAAGAVVLLVFVAVARPSPSVLRAALMAAIALAALASGRPRQALPALSAALLALLLYDPQLASNAGFAMSVLATGALLVLAPGWAEALRRRRIPAGIAEGVAVAAAAHVVTAPVIAAISGRISLVAIPANVLAEPVVAIATILGFGAAVLSPVWLTPAALLAELAGWPCRWLVWVANFFGGMHGATFPWPGGVAGGLALVVLVGSILAAGTRAGPRRALTAAALAALVVLIPVRSATSDWPPTNWTFVACDVGQGDALVLAAGAHAGVVIDAGPEPVAVDRCLRDLGITDVPLLVFTHFHLDHVGGIGGVLRGRQLARVITGPLNEPASGVRLVRSALLARGVQITTPRAGQSFDVGRVHLDVLAPIVAFHNTRSDPNNSSLVLRATIDGERILLPGDAEIEAQQALISSGADLRADVLKVPHHGSAYSDPAFLAAVQAKVAVISVGLHNDYGHPSPLLLTELARLGAPVRRTDRDGDVAVVQAHGSISTVLRGTRSSTVGLAGPPPRSSLPAVALPAVALPAVELPGIDAVITLPGCAAKTGVCLAAASAPMSIATSGPSLSWVSARTFPWPAARSPPRAERLTDCGAGIRSVSALRPQGKAGMPGAISAASRSRRGWTGASAPVRRRCQDGAMPVRSVGLDDLPDHLPGVVVLLGDEDLLVGRGISALGATARRQDPSVIESECAGGDIDGPELHELVGPSLFGDARLVVIRAAQDVKVAALAILRTYLEAPVEGTTIVLHHAGGAKGKPLLECARKSGALEIACAKLTRTDERVDFVRGEVRRAGATIAPDALAALVDAVGSDLRELAAVSGQLVSDSGGHITVDLVRAYHRGRAEVTGFAVSDLAVVGNSAGALEAMRFALSVGVAHVVIADALADGIRTIARVATAGRGDPYTLAPKLGMPPWKVKRAQGHARGWSEPGVRRALGVVATLNADVKGAAADPSYALERAVRQLAEARAQR